MLAFGTKIECDYQGSGKWFPGTIMGVNGEQYDILYDDGDGESGVPADRVREKGAAGSDTSAPAATTEKSAEPASSVVPVANKSGFEAGMKVEVRKGKEFKNAIVSAVDEILGCMDVEFSDGQAEKGIPLQMVRKPEKSSKKKKEKKKSAGKLMNECNKLLSSFNERELEAAFKMLQAVDSLRGPSEP
jgi:hypothetical protein